MCAGAGETKGKGGTPKGAQFCRCPLGHRVNNSMTVIARWGAIVFDSVNAIDN